MRARLDLPEVSRRDESGSIVEATVVAHDPAYQLTHLSFGGQSMSMTGLIGMPGDRVSVRIFATDVAIALQKPEGISIRNVLPATITAIRVDNNLPHADILLESGGHAIRARLTRASLDDLGLAESQRVFALL